jgi:hypothetical protein
VRLCADIHEVRGEAGHAALAVGVAPAGLGFGGEGVELADGVLEGGALQPPVQLGREARLELDQRALAVVALHEHLEALCVGGARQLLRLRRRRVVLMGRQGNGRAGNLLSTLCRQCLLILGCRILVF